MNLLTSMRAASYAASLRSGTVNFKTGDEIEFRRCCGKRVRRCPHGFRVVKHNGPSNRAARRWLRFTKPGRAEAARLLAEAEAARASAEAAHAARAS